MHFRALIILILLPSALNAQKVSKFKSSFSRQEDLQPFIDSANIVYKENPAKAFDYIEKALSKSVKNNDKFIEGLCYQTLGKINMSLHQSDLALNYLNKSVGIFSDLQTKNALNETYLLLGDAYYDLNNFLQAIHYYELYLSFATKNKYINNSSEVKKKLADSYAKAGDVNKSVNLYNEIVATEKKKGNSQEAINAQNSLGDIYFNANQEDKALSTYKKSEELAKESQNKAALSNSLIQQSKVLRNKKDYTNELKVREEILDNESQVKNKTGEAEQNIEIGNIYVSSNNADKAIPYIEKGLKITEETGNLEQKGKALQALSTAYSQKEDYGKALQLYRQYVSIMDEIYKKREAEIKSDIELSATLGRKLQRLDLIEKELSLSGKTIELLKQEKITMTRQKKAQKVYTFSILIAFIVLAGASLLVYRSSLQKRKVNQLLALKSLRSQMNPHFIYNSLNSVNNYISKNDEKSANKYLSEFSKLMRAVMENSKHDFVPLSSEIDILSIYLKLEHSRFSDKFDYTFDVDAELDPEHITIPPMLIQPFIENAIWHGLRYRTEKGFLKIAILNNTTDLLITIDDNGIGREKSTELKTKNQKEHNSTGVKNIENRIGLINNLFNIKINVQVTDLNPQDKTGTHVTIKIPINNG